MWVEPSLGKLCSDSLQWGATDDSKPGTELVQGHAHCLAAGTVFIISTYLPSTNFTEVCVFFLPLLGLEKMGFLWADPPLHQHRDIIDLDNAHLEGRSSWREREKQHSWCCSFPQPVTRERGSHSHRNAVWCWQSLELQIPMGRYSHRQLVFTNTCVLGELTKAEFKPDTNKLCLICCCFLITVVEFSW